MVLDMLIGHRHMVLDMMMMIWWYAIGPDDDMMVVSTYVEAM